MDILVLFQRGQTAQLFQLIAKNNSKTLFIKGNIQCNWNRT